MVLRYSLGHVHQKAQNAGGSRATIREIDDKHLMQQVKQADVFHSETPSDFERFQMVGLTSVPLKQEQSSSQSNKEANPETDGTSGWNHNQPTGKAAEAIMMYINGSRSHPVAFVDDRRVRPYAMKEGETALYAASGTGQMLFHNDDGSFLVVTNNPQEQAQTREDKERYASIRHVVKEKQSREIGEGQEVQDHKHEGETVNTEIRTTSSKIQIMDGETVVAVYDKSNKSWTFQNMTTININATDTLNLTAKTVNVTASDNALNLNGKPINFNGGGPTMLPATIPG